MNKSFNIHKIEAHFKEVLGYAPGMLANDALNFFLDRFQQQNWIDNYPESWPGRKVNSKKNNSRNLLILTGRGRRSIRVSEVSTQRTVISTDVDYMKAHNDGFKGVVNVKEYTRNRYGKQKIGSGKLNKSGKERMKTVQRITGTGLVRAHTMKMNIPRRRFMGESAVLTQQLLRHLTAELMKGLR